MLGLEDLKNRLMQFVSSTVNLFIRDRAVETPRFTYLSSLERKTGGPDPDELGLGDVYRDETSGKEYLVDDFYFNPKSEEPPRYYVQSIDEIVSRPAGETRFAEEVFKTVVQLKTADIDVQEDLITFLKSDYEKSGVEFHDRRERSTTMKGAAMPPKTATPV
jgi:hypothetical protein